MNRKIAVVRDDTKPTLIIDADLYSTLVALAERARKDTLRLAERLLEELERADLRPRNAMPTDVVTIGSKVTYHDGERTHVVELVMPRDADVARGRVSVVTPVGAALLGLSAGQKISWEIGYGKLATIDVLEVKAEARCVRSQSP